MGEVVDPSRASIDGLIDWLREKRVRQPGAKLTDLLSNHRFDPQRLVDLACIDLIQRRRMGHAVTVEDYLQEFPALEDQQTQLDLIDAELCVVREMGGRADVDSYSKRFPLLAEAIAELMALDGAMPSMMTSALIDLGDSLDCSVDSTNLSGDFSIETCGQSPTGLSEVISPVDVPDWFVGEKCVASSPGRWLIQGRDSTRGIVLALKVIELPMQVTAAEHEEILDACERASRVRNPAWVMPSVAAIQNRRLAVIRPWVFAHPWHQSPVPRQRDAELRSLASVAFAIQAAHEVEATHGGIQMENLMVDHSGKVQVVDAVCSRDGLPRWLRCPGSGFPTAQPSAHQYRMNLDAQGLIKLIVATSIEWSTDWASHLANDLRGIAVDHPGEACGRIGELLIRRADDDFHPSMNSTVGRTGLRQRPWQRRLKRWLSGN